MTPQQKKRWLKELELFRREKDRFLLTHPFSPFLPEHRRKLKGLPFFPPDEPELDPGLQSGATYLSKHGCLEAKAELAARDLDPADWDAVVVPGGWAPDKLRRDEGVLRLVRGVAQRGGIVAMICHGGLVGISAGIVRGRKATGSLGIKDDLVNAGATWVDEPAFRDGNLVWGRVVADIPVFLRELVSALATSPSR